LNILFKERRRHEAILLEKSVAKAEAISIDEQGKGVLRDC